MLLFELAVEDDSVEVAAVLVDEARRLLEVSAAESEGSGLWVRTGDSSLSTIGLIEGEDQSEDEEEEEEEVMAIMLGSLERERLRLEESEAVEAESIN